MTILTPYALPNLAALKALTGSQRTDKYMRLVVDPNIAGTITGQPASWYIYDAGTSVPELGNLIIRPNDNPSGFGVWFKMSAPYYHKSNAAPTVYSGIRSGIIWEANLSTPTRTIYYYSVTNTWVPFGNKVLVLDADPAFTPDFAGQMVWNTTTNKLFVAEATTSSSDWVQIS